MESEKKDGENMNNDLVQDLRELERKTFPRFIRYEQGKPLLDVTGMPQFPFVYGHLPDDALYIADKEFIMKFIEEKGWE